MPDLYLQSLLHGKEKGQTPDRFQEAIDKEIETYIEANFAELSIKKQTDYIPLHLKTSKLKEQIKSELLESTSIPELSDYIKKALNILENLKSDNIAYALEIENALILLNNLNPEDCLIKTLQQNLNISSNAIQWLVDLANAKFKEKNYSDALSLFLFATTLNDEQVDYFFRAAIAAQKNNNCPLALQLYSIVTANDPNFIGSRLFTVECYLQEGLYDKAMAEWFEAEKIVNNSEIEAPWLDFLSTLKNLLDLTTQKGA